MTESEWLMATDPERILIFNSGKVGDRKLRLFAIVCCRSVWKLFRDDRCRKAVEVAELFDDKRASARELKPAQIATEEVLSLEDPLWAAAWGSASKKALDAVWESQREIVLHVCKELKIRQVVLLRCIFGNPFRPIIIRSSWLTSTVTTLAQQMYESRDFSPMPILADVLQDAGCDNDEVLNHCRQPGVHGRGWFVVDLLLGKT